MNAQKNRLTKLTVGFIAATLVAVMPTPSSALAPQRVVTAAKIPSSIAAGSLVTATPAKWSAAVTRKYQWLLSGKPIARATTLKYQTSAAQIGKALRFKETARFSNGKTIVSMSLPVVIGKIMFLAEPSIMYIDANQNSAQVYPPSVRPSNVTLAYQWLREGKIISGANTSSYVFTGADQGALISLRITASKAGFRTTVAESTTLEGPLSFAAETQLLWSDEFNDAAGTAPNANNWVAQEGDGVAYGNRGWGNNERQWYLLNQAKHDGNGNLVITATRTGADQYNCYYPGQCEWISSKLVTLNKIGVRYGRMSIRMKGAAGVGTWPAFWTLGTNIAKVGWPRCGEIDIVELAGYTPTTVWGTPHGPISWGPGVGRTVELAQPADQDFHEYTVDWYEDRMIWYVDGVAFHVYRKSEYETDWVFNEEQYLILNLAMGGNFGRDIDPNLTESNIQVDWVRVYRVNGVGELITH